MKNLSAEPLEGALTVRQAANKARVPYGCVLQLCRAHLVFTAQNAAGQFILSEAVVTELPRLFRKHFRNGEFVEAPEISEYRGSSIYGVTTEHSMEVH